jgi:hypothetical protein
MPHVVIVADGRFIRQSSILTRRHSCCNQRGNSYSFGSSLLNAFVGQQFRYAAIDPLILN